MKTRARIAGIGLHLPEKVMKNEEFSAFLDTNDEWIRSRTGIEERRIFDRADSSLKASDLAVAAAQKVLAQTGTDPLEIDGIIVGGLNPDWSFPATACVVQGKLGAKNAFAFDLTAACAFLPFALSHASLLIESGQCKKILVIGAELISRILDWSDRNTCVLFGDGAAALLLEPSGSAEEGILATALKSDGRVAEILTLPKDGCLKMDGKAVFKVAVTEMAAIVEKTLAANGYTLDDVALLIPHQANIRILQATQERLKLRDDQVFVNVHKYGNTSSVSVPLALAEAIESGRVKKGDLIVTVAIGGGMSWGCNLIRW